MSRPAPRYDLAWTPANARALLALGVACGLLALVAFGASDSVFAGEDLPDDPERSAAVRERINPNTAPAASLERLRGIGPKRAAAIVDWRSARDAPAFERPEDLMRIPGIGPGTLRDIRPHLNLSAR